MEEIIKTNEFQTKITKELLSNYPEEVAEQFMDFIDTVPLLKWMIGERPRAKDLPRDEHGRIVVDIAHPHILEDMDYFRPAARFFDENGCYSFLKPNANPNSEYGKWFAEEVNRCRFGYVRESDGEWVTGLMYFYLNYCPIMLNRLDEDSGVFVRTESFPDFWEGIYYRFHYIDQARKASKHGMELARRGASKSYSLAAIMARNLLLGERKPKPNERSRLTTVLTAFTKEYLSDKDGTFTKFSPIVDFCASHTEFPRLMLKRSPSEMIWRMGYKNANGNEMGSLNSVMGLSVKDDEGKVRGKRGYILYEEMGSYKNFKETWDNVRDSVKEGSRVFSEMFAVGTAGDDASDFAGVKTMLYNPDAYEVYALENVFDQKGKGTGKFAFFFPSYISRAGCMDKDGNSDVVKAVFEILMERWMVKQGGDSASLLSRIAQMPITPAEAILKVRSNFFPVVMLNERIRQLDQNPHAYDDVYVGTLIDAGGKVVFRSTEDVPIRKWPVDNTEQGAIEIFVMPPDNIPQNRYIIGCLTPGQLVTTESGLKKVEDVTLCDKLLNKDGEYVSIKNLQVRFKNNETVYTIRLCDTIDTVELTGNHPVYAATPEKHYHSWKTHLKTGVPAVYYKYDFAFRRADQLKIGDVVKAPIPYVEERDVPYHLWKRDKIKGLRRINNPLGKWKFWWFVGLFLGDGWCGKGNVNVCFNSSEKQYINRFKNVVSEIFNRKTCIAKSHNNCDEYTFRSRQFCDFFTKWFGKYADGKQIPEWVKYLPKDLKVALITGYLDSDGCCCKDSIEFVSISKKLLRDIQDILLSIGIVSCIKLLRGPKVRELNGRISNTKSTYSLAIARAGVEKLSSILGGMDIKLKRFDYRDTVNHSTKPCWISEDGKYVYYKITNITQRQYSGLVYNFECDTHSYMCGRLPVHNCDPTDNDQAESASLFSCFVFDLFTDEIVAEYTGRKPFAEDNYELARLLAIFYNASIMYESNRKGLYSYFAKKQCTWMLADCPEYLRARQLVKYSMFGSSIKGITVNAPVIAFANDLIRDWLNKTQPTEVKDERGEIHIEQVPQLYKIRNRALLQELISYSREVNTDRVSALAQVMLYREHFMILYGGSPDASGLDLKELSDDEFFDRDWNKYKARFGDNYQSVFKD